jgi:hypothetical protein
VTSNALYEGDEQVGRFGRAKLYILVHYKSGPSRAKGLVPKVASGSGRVSWTWRVGSNTTPGRWPIVVTCEKGNDHGELRTSFEVD